MGDALERLDVLIDWKMFSAELERIDRKERKPPLSWQRAVRLRPAGNVGASDDRDREVPSQSTGGEVQPLPIRTLALRSRNSPASSARSSKDNAPPPPEFPECPDIVTLTDFTVSVVDA